MGDQDYCKALEERLKGVKEVGALKMSLDKTHEEFEKFEKEASTSGAHVKDLEAQVFALKKKSSMTDDTIKAVMDKVNVLEADGKKKVDLIAEVFRGPPNLKRWLIKQLRGLFLLP